MEKKIFDLYGTYTIKSPLASAVQRMEGARTFLRLLAVQPSHRKGRFFTQLFLYKTVSICAKELGKNFASPSIAPLQINQREKTVQRFVGLEKQILATHQVYRKSEKNAIKKLKIAVLWIQCTRNNTLITLTDISGKTLAWSSSGACGFKNSRKSTTHAAETVAIKMSEKIYERGYNSIHVRTRGSGRGKKKAISALSRCGLVIHEITEYGPQAFNGCRSKRKRRL